MQLMLLSAWAQAFSSAMPLAPMGTSPQAIRPPASNRTVLDRRDFSL